MRRRSILLAGTVVLTGAAVGFPGLAEEPPFKVGITLSLTGPFAASARQTLEGAQLYEIVNGDTVAGRKIELVVKDDGGVADNAKRVVQEMIVQDKIDAIAGASITPVAMAVAPLATRAKLPFVVTTAATAAVTDQSPNIVRTGYTTGQVTSKLGEWAAKEGIKRVVTIVSDYGPGLDSEKVFSEFFTRGGGEVIDTLRVPLQSTDFSPFLQKVAEKKPDAVFVYTPGFGAQFLKQYVERGLDKAGIRLLADGGFTDDDYVNAMGDAALSATTALQYSAAHDSPENAAFVAAFEKAYGGKRPSFTAVGGYDAMHLIYAALEKAGPDASGEALVEAMKGLEWTSPRGPVHIDPATREMIQNIYIRRVERVDGELWNVEFETFEAVSDPAKVGG